MFFVFWTDVAGLKLGACLSHVVLAGSYYVGLAVKMELTKQKRGSYTIGSLVEIQDALCDARCLLYVGAPGVIVPFIISWKLNNKCGPPSFTMKLAPTSTDICRFTSLSWYFDVSQF